MNDRIRQILEQINALEEELRTELYKKQSQWLYRIRGRRVVFESSIRAMHRRLKVGVFRWLMTVRPQNYLTAPIIYGMIFPIVLLDITLAIYQWTCFPIYGVARVRRSDYITLDLRQLAYLNWIEKLDCMYCSYGNGLIGYAREILARTEQYFCPIKHARKMQGMHERYSSFIDYGDAGDLHARFEALRLDLINEERRQRSAVPPRDNAGN
jgi:hypothetical protein